MNTKLLITAFRLAAAPRLAAADCLSDAERAQFEERLENRFLTSSLSLGATFGYTYSPAATGTTVVDLGGRAGFNLTINDNIGIPPPAAYVPSRSYCSKPGWLYSPFAGRWNYACYNHDVCYGSQKGRLYCDVVFWREMVSACTSRWAPDPLHDACISEADLWYSTVRIFGQPHYKPRQTSYEPRGN